MRFRFCGDADCPDWVLAEITMLSRLSSVKLKSLAHIVAKSIENPPLDIEKAEKLFADAKLDPDVDLKRCIACVSFIMTSATRFHCDQGVLASELQQLGLPREHSQSLRKVYVDHSNIITGVLRDKSLRVNRVGGIEIKTEPTLNTMELTMQINGDVHTVRMPQGLMNTMLKDLKEQRALMKEIANNDHTCHMY